MLAHRKTDRHTDNQTRSFHYCCVPVTGAELLLLLLLKSYTKYTNRPTP